MGLTATSTGTTLLQSSFSKEDFDFTIALAGNPNVGKSTIFNALTGMHQHTGNWPGKTVANASGICEYKKKKFLFVDIPGTYSIMSHSQEEEIARDYICFSHPDATVIVLDATCLERNLNLVFQTMEITPHVIVCVNLLDEAKKKGIEINLPHLSKLLGVPVVGTTARKPKTLQKLLNVIEEVCTKKIETKPKCVHYLSEIESQIEEIAKELPKTVPLYLHRWVSLKLLDGEPSILSSISEHLSFTPSSSLKQKVEKAKEILQKEGLSSSQFRNKIVSQIVFHAEEVALEVCHYTKQNYQKRDQKIDQILTSKKFGIPIMLLLLGFIFWLTIVGANYPSALLSEFFQFLQDKLLSGAQMISMPAWLSSLLILGVYQTVTWVISVMLPPMALFFPMFTILEDLGYLPRVAFNLDHLFQKAGTTGKQALTLCMRFWL